MYRTIQLALKARIDTILRAKHSPTFTTDPTGLSITLDTSQTSTTTTVYAKYTVASTQTPNYGLIDLNTDGGTSNDVDFQLGYPDASNIVVTPSVWPVGQTTNITITGTNVDVADSTGTIVRLRSNFQEYAVIGSNTSTVVVSQSNLAFYARESCVMPANGIPTFSNSISGDNQVGSGSTPLTWNLN